jgi:hypothetical protein
MKNRGDRATIYIYDRVKLTYIYIYIYIYIYKSSPGRQPTDDLGLECSTHCR